MLKAIEKKLIVLKTVKLFLNSVERSDNNG